ncbi:MAG TPA: ABC transporter ATP-binding protein [Reyranella sp.]|nr:ABC transporter ATP-binding protein [Reyranella sp.]
MNLLEVRNLSVAYGDVAVVRDVSFTLAAGRSLGIVGESGSGKTQTMLAVLRLLARGGRVTSGSVLFEGRDLLTLSPGEMRQVRGRGLAFVPQDALSALNPAMTVGAQMAEPLIFNEGMGEEAALARCTELLGQVGIPGAAARLAAYPHQLSGGMRQRVLIAMAIAAHPKLLIADEPTTALDVTIQDQILRLLDRLRRELDMALVLISHDLGVVAGVADRVSIMYAGRIVESASAAEVFGRPAHPYARALMAAKPRLDRPAGALQPIAGLPPDPAHPLQGCAFHPRCAFAIERCGADTPPLEAVAADHLAACWRAREQLAAATTASMRVADAEQPAGEIVVEDLSVRFPIRSGILRRATGTVRAVEGVSFAIPMGKTVALVGESGSGKTTTGRALLGLAPMSNGRVSYFGRDVAAIRQDMPRLGQMVFQDPYGSLNPRMTVGATLAEVVSVHGLVPRGQIGRKVDSLLDSVGLRPAMARRHPHELSGGQRQRVAIARALAIEPRFIVCDEVVSALDVSIQGQIINLLMELQRTRGLTYLFISHDLAMVRHIAHHVVVMYGGKVMEAGPRDRLFAEPRHPYTHALLGAVPVPDPEVERKRTRPEVRGETPDPADPPPGCRFHRSCRHADERCRREEPLPEAVAAGHTVACHRWQELAQGLNHA